MSHSSNESASAKKNNIVRVRVTVRGTRPLLQHQFTSDSIALEKEEKDGVAGNSPGEWKKSCMVTKDGQLFFRGDYIFSMLRNAGKHTKKGRGSLMSIIPCTLQIEENIILLDRFIPQEGDPKHNDYDSPVYIDVRPVRNPKTKGRNIRYRLAASPGWTCSWTMLWDKTVVSRNEMRAVTHDAGVYCGLADGVGVGMGRFEVVSYEELSGAEEEVAEGSVGDELPTEGVGKRRGKVRPLPEEAFFDGMPH